MATIPSSTATKDAAIENHESRPDHWVAALISLFSARLALFQLEAKESAGLALRRVICLVAAVICLFFTWLLLLAGTIAATAAMTGWPWYLLAIAAASFHLIAAIVLAKVLSKPAQPAFPITRAEFQKDREWIEKLQKKPKSNA